VVRARSTALYAKGPANDPVPRFFHEAGVLWRTTNSRG